MNPFILLVIGLLLVFLEFFVPGAVFGILGGIAIAASLVFFAMENHSPWEVLLYFTTVVVLLVYLVKFALWRIRKTNSKHSLYSDADQEGFVASSFDHSAIGKHGTVLTDLKPGGYILVGDKKYQAISLSGYLSRGSEVEVIDGQEESLLVKPIKDKKL
ncbi:MAG: serine protease [Parachlamydiaceae bacterium]|nr:serine protease [Parachlamydiaceae bacterium]